MKCALKLRFLVRSILTCLFFFFSALKMGFPVNSHCSGIAAVMCFVRNWHIPALRYRGLLFVHVWGVHRTRCYLCLVAVCFISPFLAMRPHGDRAPYYKKMVWSAANRVLCQDRGFLASEQLPAQQSWDLHEAALGLFTAGWGWLHAQCRIVKACLPQSAGFLVWNTGSLS